MIGMVFFQLPFVISSNTNIFAGGLLWVCLMGGWVHVFKVFHISKTDRRTEHELANNKYSPGAFLLADFITTSILTMMFISLYKIIISDTWKESIQLCKNVYNSQNSLNLIEYIKCFLPLLKN
jgi:hypothetical protein